MILVVLVLLFVLILHAGVLYPRNCLASMEMGQQPIEVDRMDRDVDIKVDMYLTPIPVKKWTS